MACEITSEPMMTAPSSRNNVKLLVKLKLPVTHLPLGTFNWAPPFASKLFIFFIATEKAAVFDVTPSPTPPNSTIDIFNSLAGNDPSHVSDPEKSKGIPGSETGRSGNPDSLVVI